MKVFNVSWNDPETVVHGMLWKKSFTVYPSLTNTFFTEHLRTTASIRDRLQISLLILSEFKYINELLLPLKSLKNLQFSDDFMGNRS